MTVTTMIVGASPTRSISSPNTMIASRMKTCGRTRLRSIGCPSNTSARSDNSTPIRSSAQLKTVGR